MFGYAGDGIDPLLGALRRAGGPAFVQARHEEAAALGVLGQQAIGLGAVGVRADEAGEEQHVPHGGPDVGRTAGKRAGRPA